MKRILLVLTAFIVITSCSCGSIQKLGKDVLDCTVGSAAKAVDQYAPLLDEVVTNATRQDGSMDWSRIESATKNFEAATGGCVLASIVNRALHPAPPKPGAPQSEALVADPIALREGFERVRVKLGGKTYKTADGDL